MPLVAVVRDRYVPGHSDTRDGKHVLDVLELRAALARAWPTDAHLVPYVLHGPNGRPLARQPRVTKAGLERLLAAGHTLRCETMFGDIDNPGHAAWTEALRAELERLRRLPCVAAAGLYTTAHGWRLVVVLRVAICEMGLYERTLAAWHRVLLAAGIPVDTGCRDWTRLYRLPYVVRDGRRTEAELYLDAMQPVDAPEPLPLPEPRAHKREPRAAPGPAPSDVASAWTAERLAPVADVLRGLPVSGRHNLGLALGGALCELDVPPADVEGIARALVAAAGWDRDHARGVPDSVARWCATRPTRGMRYLDTHAPPTAAALRLAARASNVVANPEAIALPASLDAVIAAAAEGVTLVRSPCGSGKTQAAIRVAIARARSLERWARRTCIAVPTTALAVQVVASIRVQAPELPVARLAGVLSVVDPGSGAPVCVYADAGRGLAAGGQSIPASYCERGGRGRCEYASTCAAYGGVLGSRDAEIWVSTHAQLAQLVDLAGQTGVVIVDETPALLEHALVTRDDVAHVLETAGRFDADYMETVRPLLDAAVAAIERADDADLLSQPVAAILREVELALALDRGDLLTPPLRFGDMISSRQSPIYARSLGAASRVLRALVRAATQTDARARTLRLPRGAMALSLTTAAEGVRAALLRVGRTVVLDAQAELASALVERVAGYTPPLVDVVIPPGCLVHSTHVRMRASRTSLMPGGRVDDAAVLEQLRIMIAWRNTLPVDARRCAAASYKPVIERMRDRHTPYVDALDELELKADDLLYYGASRGLDNWRDHDGLMTSGDPWPELGSNDVEAAYLGIASADERLRRRAVAELEQTRGRLRPIHRAKPVHFLHIGKLAI